ncbi:MAG: triosephosphate isomerase [Bacilli bacterium]|nr:triosephosphate isomerase [Bacilli bacterium]
MIIALNNKSNLGKEDFYVYQERIGDIEKNSQIILCPTLLNINLFDLENVSLGAQNVSTQDPGAYTGEVSAKDLKASEVSYCIVGHSERRTYQRETLEEVHDKVKKLFEYDITPILCIGETKEEREQGLVGQVLKEEIETATYDLTEEQKSRLIIAYEPIWSIGTGIIPTLEQIDEVLRFIKTFLPNTTLLYGGSANEKNIDMLKQSPLIEGYLLGGLSLKPEELQIFINKLENK